MFPAPGPTVESAVDRVIVELRARRALAVQTEIRIFGLMKRFCTFVDRVFSVRQLDEVIASHIEAFTAATTKTGAPSIATMRLRRWALRLFFRTTRELGLSVTDPTLDVALPGRTSRTPRPLTDVEVERCRAASLHDLTSTRLATAWALGEASARTAEIPHVRVCDLDLDRGRVWIHGSTQTDARHGALSDWSAVQLRRRLRELGADVLPDAVVAQIGKGNLESRKSFSSQALRETLLRAAIAPSDRVHPASLAGWVGVQIFQATRRIDQVARGIGVRSLDAAARIIDWDWRSDETVIVDG